MDESKVLLLIRQSQSGDRVALEILMDQFYPFRKVLVQRFSDKGIDNDDLSQQIDLFFIESILLYDSKKDKSPIRHIVSKTKRDTWTYYRKEMNYFVYDDFVQWTDDDSDTNPLSIQTKEDDVVDEIVIRQAIDLIPERYRYIVELYYFESLTQQEIAERLGIDQSNVNRALKRAREKLRNILEEYF